MPSFIVVGPACATCCQLLSIAGFIFLAVIGMLFRSGADTLVLGHEGVPANADAMGKHCYIAAIMYLILVMFCGCQRYANNRLAPRLS
ncbi:hypothetical protein CXG81DRAFT_12443 [Caulochytrium protostelioides]|uniref:Uncharacterized protein n=1 Tax=Caulochytrium protostelioides TaxID=1555241 RepID=A0A4P9X763_9FUNG|nr:hypothetical protein CXG81DRAFT_12443 [Caulochytrium protostelioides]|eukprot:RKP01048.1 hypothetical protein CXG81DRAFT_12443 [Caulochytrium protostelioides]